MKKSLIAMALMFGAVVFVASCGDEDPEKTCKTCTVKIVGGNGANADATSSVYVSGEYCDSDLSAVEAKNGAAIEATETNFAKGGQYSVVCE
ncbi:MAG: hypothetical protein LBU92_06690 [Prevotellaceae bacterium]|jgi:hypothetical protein|nr:hypothetical protein [Prevotellaceae bacterium]